MNKYNFSDWYTGEVVLKSSNLKISPYMDAPEKLDYDDFDEESIVKIKRTQRMIFDGKMYGYLTLLKKEFINHLYESIENEYVKSEVYSCVPKKPSKYIIEILDYELIIIDDFLSNPKPYRFSRFFKSINIDIYSRSLIFDFDENDINKILFGEYVYEMYHKKGIYDFIQSPNSNFEFYEVITPKIFYKAVVKYKDWIEKMLKKDKK
jgi:hypothetical protein